MGSRTWIAVTLPVLLAGYTAPAHPQAAPEPPSLAAIDAAFVCPEKLGSPAEQQSVLTAFLKAYMTARPAASIADMLAYRRTLLIKHGCTEMLRHLDEADRAIAAGNVRSQVWFAVLDTSAVKLSVSANHVELVLDPRAPNEKAVDTYARIQFPAPAETNVTHTRYDEVVSHNVFYCQTGRYALIENDYFLAGQKTLRDVSPVATRTPQGADLYAIDRIVPGSLNERAAGWACAVGKGSVS